MIYPSEGNIDPPDQGGTEPRAELYRFRPSEGIRVPLLVHPGEINDNIPLEAEI